MPNLGSCAKFKAVAFAKYSKVLITDDDVIPQEGFMEDLFKQYVILRLFILFLAVFFVKETI